MYNYSNFLKKKEVQEQGKLYEKRNNDKKIKKGQSTEKIIKELEKTKE